MIRNETEYDRAMRQLQGVTERRRWRRLHLRKLGIPPDEIQEDLAPLIGTLRRLRQELRAYERIKGESPGTIINFHGLGQQLIALRIARGVSQQELAKRLGVHRSQVSRDERTDYHGITLARAARILEALGVRASTTLQS